MEQLREKAAQLLQGAHGTTEPMASHRAYGTCQLMPVICFTQRTEVRTFLLRQFYGIGIN